MQSCCKALGVMGQTIQKVRLTSDMHGPLHTQPKAPPWVAAASACRPPRSFLSVLSPKGAAKPIGIPLGNAYNFRAGSGGDAGRTLIINREGVWADNMSRTDCGIGRAMIASSRRLIDSSVSIFDACIGIFLPSGQKKLFELHGMIANSTTRPILLFALAPPPPPLLLL